MKFSRVNGISEDKWVHGDADDYLKLLENILKNHDVRPVKAYPAEGRVCYLHHDVDVSIDGAVQMARLEADMDVTSTYYVMPKARYFKRAGEQIVEIQRLGHEVGIHHALMTDYYIFSRERLPLADILEEYVDALRGLGVEPETVSAHGDVYCRKRGYTNYSGFMECPVELGKIEGVEPVSLGSLRAVEFLKRDTYVTDSAGWWRHTHDQFTDEWSGKLSPGFTLEGDQLFLLTHPVWWKFYE